MLGPHRAEEAPLDGTVLLVDDDDNILTVLSLRLESAGYGVFTARDGDQAMAVVRQEKVDVVVCDLRLDQESGLDVMARLHHADPGLPVLILTAHGSIPNAIEAMNEGAAGYLTKPVDREALYAHLNKCVAQRRLSQEVLALRRTVDQRGELEGIIGQSSSMKAVFSMIERVAPLDSTVAIFGPSGSGKELAARAVHALSKRANRPFISVNCGALPDTLLQSELFGYKRGAFTDARSDKTGLIKAADGGTLLLDEIGDVSPAMQRSLLRVLQEGEISPLGSTKTQTVDVRVIVATNKYLAAMVENRSFREDLYYRLVVVPIYMPALKDRVGDIPLLAEHFLAKHCARLNRTAQLSPEASQHLMERRWPGNARELEHAVERALVLSFGEVLQVEDFADTGVGPGGHRGADIKPLREARDAWEREYLEDVLKATGGNVSAAARKAGKYRADLYGLLKKHGLEPGDYK